MAYIFNTEVSTHDIDLNGNAKPSEILRYLQEAANKNFSDMGPSYSELLENNLSFIISRAAINIYSPLKELEKISVETWATENSGVIFPRSYRIKSGENVLVEALMNWALINTTDKSFVRGSEFDVSVYGTDEPLDISTRFKIPKDMDLKLVGEKKVMYSDIDKNRHMNNTKYPNVLFDYIPNVEKLFISGIMINFASEAPFGATLKILMSEAEVTEDGLNYYFRTTIDDKTNIEALIRVKEI